MKTKYLCCTPILIVNDQDRAKSFYVEKLGFEVTFEWGKPLTYLGIQRDHVEIHLNVVSNAPYEAGRATLSIITDEVDDLYENCLRNGVETTTIPVDRTYGLRSFGIKDPDGNIIHFGCDITNYES